MHQKNYVIQSILSLLLLSALTISGVAQTFRGSVAGSVTDSSGAAVPGAAITLVSNSTGLTRVSTASSVGQFNFPDLPLGKYTMTVSKKGFDTTKVANVNVQVGQTFNLTVSLKVAEQASTVEVSADQVAIETSSSTLNSVITDKQVQEIPLNGRDFTQLVKLAPGMNGAGSLNGTRSNSLNWQIDGTDNNDTWQNYAAVNQGGVSGIAGTLLPIEAIDQVSVQSNSDAEAGHSGGGMVNVAIKSGTNQLHGSVYYFNRNDALAAQDPFAPTGAPTPKLKNSQFGFSLGGPIIHNKTFYFITYEGQRFIAGNTLQDTNPSGAWVNQATALLQRYNVPVNSVSTNLLSLWPSYGRSGPATSPNFFGNDDNDYNSDNGIIKLDHIFNDSNNVSFRYFGGTGSQTAYVGSTYHDYFQVAPSRMHNFSLVFNTAFSPNMLNQLVLGLNYFKQTFNDFNNSANPVAMGLNTGVTDPALSGSPSITINGFSQVGLTPPLGRVDTTGQITDTLSYNTGAHQFRFGGEFRRANLSVFYDRNKRGSFTFDGTVGPWANDSSVSDPVKALADFMAGDVSSSSIVRGNLKRNYFIDDFDLFATDSWHVSPKLTLNYGVQWAYDGPIYDPYHMISTFVPSMGGIVFPGRDVQINSLYPQQWDNFAPRVGFAYSPTRNGKVVVRGGYGIFYDAPVVNAFGDNRPPNGGASGVLANPAGPDPVFTLRSNDYTIVPNQPLFGDANLPSPPYGVFSVSQNFSTPYVENYNLNVQFQLSSNTVLQMGYVGSAAHHLLIVRDINQAAPSTTPSATDLTSRPFYSTFPQYRAINEVQTIGNSNYNSFQASLQSSNWHGVSSQLSYTYGHSLDDLSGVRGVNPTNSNNLAFDYGNASFDIRHTLTAFFSYPLPRSHHMTLLTNGWQINSLLSFHSGQPFTLYAGKNISGTYEGRDRVNQVGNPAAGASPTIIDNNGSKYVQWFNPAAFTLPQPGTFGTVARNSLYGPGFGDVDVSLFKDTAITERLKTQIRIEMFNVFNQLNLAPPSSTYGGSFGQITSTIGAAQGAPGIGSGEPFNIQLALKLLF